LLLGGLLAEVIGIRATMVVAGIGALTAPVILSRTDIAQMRDLPTPVGTATAGLPIAPPLID
jgi:hypothetical protein